MLCALWRSICESELKRKTKISLRNELMSLLSDSINSAILPRAAVAAAHSFIHWFFGLSLLFRFVSIGLCVRVFYAVFFCYRRCC